MKGLKHCPTCDAQIPTGTLCAICEVAKFSGTFDTEKLMALREKHNTAWPSERIKAQVARIISLDDETFAQYVKVRTLDGTTMYGGLNDSTFFKMVFTKFEHLLSCIECEMCAKESHRSLEIHFKKRAKAPMLAAITKHLEKHGASPALMKSLTEIPDRELLGYAEPREATP